MLERLTGRDKTGVYYKHGAESGIHPYADRPPHDCKEAIEHLADYEDSGLSPEEVQEIAKAKADGRLVGTGMWERMINPYGEFEGFMCKCGHQSESATNYCSHCGRKMFGWEATDKAIREGMEGC